MTKHTIHLCVMGLCGVALGALLTLQSVDVEPPQHPCSLTIEAGEGHAVTRATAVVMTETCAADVFEWCAEGGISIDGATPTDEASFDWCAEYLIWQGEPAKPCLDVKP